jgi:hypothetical protein
MILSDQRRAILRTVLDIASSGNTDLIVEENSIFSIKPDRLQTF